MPEQTKTTTTLTTTRRRRRSPRQAQKKVTTIVTKESRPANQLPPTNATIRRSVGRNRSAAARVQLTKAGRSWLRLYLNPMARDDPGVIGYPDGSASRSVLADYREDFHFTMPAPTSVYLAADVNEHPTTDGDNSQWSKFLPKEDSEITVLFMQLPLVEKAILIRIYRETPTKFLTGVGRNFAFLENPRMYPQFDAYEADGSGCIKGSDIGFLQSVVKLDNIGRHARTSIGFRLIARGSTFIYTVPKLEEQGFVTTAQFDTPSEVGFTTSQAITKTDLTKGSDGNYTLPVETGDFLQKAKYVMRHSNITPSTLVECFHNAYTSKASDGAYVPLYNNQRDLKYQLHYDREVELIGDETDPAGDANKENGNFRITDTPVLGWNTAVTWFEGVSRNCSIKMKHRSVVQYVPAPGSDIANFTRQEPDEDHLALEVAWKMRNKMAHAYPACYNDWGWLGDLIDRSLTSLPFVGPLYGAVKPLIKPAWDWLGDRARDWTGQYVNLN